MFHFMMYNDLVVTPAAEAGPSAGSSAGPSAGSLTGPASLLAVSIYAPGQAPPGPTCAPGPTSASASSVCRKFQHPCISTITGYSSFLLYHSDSPMPWQSPSGS